MLQTQKNPKTVSSIRERRVVCTTLGHHINSRAM